MDLRALICCLLLTGCAHAAPMAAVPMSRMVSAKAASNVITKATFEGTNKPLQQRFTITLEGSTSLKLSYFWKPWAGMGFTSGTVDGAALDAHNAAVCAERLTAASLQPGVDGKIVERAVQLLRELAGS